MNKAQKLIAELSESARSEQNYRVFKDLEGGEWAIGERPGGATAAFKVSPTKIMWKDISFDMEKVAGRIDNTKKSLKDVGQILRLSDGSNNRVFKRVK